MKVGRENFDKRRYVYFRDDNAAWQAFTKGGFEDIRPENRSQRWAIGYDFPAFKAGDVIKTEFETTSSEPMQGFVLNMRRPQFQDRRVRQALTYAFDFESMNRTLFFGFYTRTDSYFEGSELASSGLPHGKELEILEPYPRQAAARSVHRGIQAAGLRHAAGRRATICGARCNLFKEAGWVSKGGKMVNEKTGEQFKIEIPRQRSDR